MIKYTFWMFGCLKEGKREETAQMFKMNQCTN